MSMFTVQNIFVITCPNPTLQKSLNPKMNVKLNKFLQIFLYFSSPYRNKMEEKDVKWFAVSCYDVFLEVLDASLFSWSGSADEFIELLRITLKKLHFFA